MSDAVKPDTNEAEVVRAAEMLEAYDFDVTAALLRDLLAERDAARAEADARGYECAQAATHAHTLTEELAQAMAERDALRAQLADVLAENDAVRFQLNNALAALREAGHE